MVKDASLSMNVTDRRRPSRQSPRLENEDFRVVMHAHTSIRDVLSCLKLVPDRISITLNLVVAICPFVGQLRERTRPMKKRLIG
jgi:hypothetical protein